MDRWRVALCVAVGGLVLCGVARAGMTRDYRGLPGHEEGMDSDYVFGATPIWKTELTKLNAPSGRVVTGKLTKFYSSGLRSGLRYAGYTGDFPDLFPGFPQNGISGSCWGSIGWRPAYHWRFGCLPACGYDPACRWKDRDCPGTPAVPVPGALGLAGMGAVAAGWLRRRRVL